MLGANNITDHSLGGWVLEFLPGLPAIFEYIILPNLSLPFLIVTDVRSGSFP